MFKATTSFLRMGAFAALMSLLATPALAKGGEAIHVLQGHWEEVGTVAFSPDGKYVASGDSDGEVIVWDVSDGSRHFSPDWGGQIAIGVEFSPDSKDLFVAQVDFDRGTLARYSIEEKERIDGAIITTPVSLAISKDGKYLAYAERGSSNAAHIITSKDLAPAHSLIGHKRSVELAKFSPDGKSIVTASFDGSLGVWDAKDGTRKFQIRAEKGDWFDDVTFSPDGRHIAYLESGFIIADAKTGKVLKQDFIEFPGSFATHGALHRIAYHPNGHLVAAASTNGSIFLWDVETGDLLGELAGKHDKSVLSIAFSGDGSMLVSGGADNRVVIWQLD